jgi:hypothetical protein
LRAKNRKWTSALARPTAYRGSSFLWLVFQRLLVPCTHRKRSGVGSTLSLIMSDDVRIFRCSYTRLNQLHCWSQRRVPIRFRPRDELLTMTAPIHDDHRLHRFPPSHDQMLETMTTYRPFPVALRDVARARRDALAVFIEPDGGRAIPPFASGTQPEGLRFTKRRVAKPLAPPLPPATGPVRRARGDTASTRAC